MWNLKYDTNDPIYEIEIESDTENRLVVAKGEGWIGSWDYQMQTIVYSMDK